MKQIVKISNESGEKTSRLVVAQVDTIGLRVEGGDVEDVLAGESVEMEVSPRRGIWIRYDPVEGT